MKKGMIRVDENVKADVERVIAGSSIKIGEFYTDAAKEKIEKYKGQSILDFNLDKIKNK